ncbi:MAG: hypothetical protein ACLP7Q_05170 [Isosphaeraceae bacterium]
MSIPPTGSPDLYTEEQHEPGDSSPSALLQAFLIAFLLVAATRLPVARSCAIESDEFGYLEQIRAYLFPMHHTLFLALGRVMGQLAGDPYRGFILLDVASSALALVSVWWFLRALVTPGMAVAGSLLLGAGPVFWGYGAMAGNYTAIIAVGAFLLGVAWRTWHRPRPWHPFAAAAVLALGTGYRQDIGTLWMPVFLLILWKHRWKSAFYACLLFTVLNLTWLLAMLHDVGGWTRYRVKSAEFAYSAGYLNSVWNLGLVDAPLRYAIKLSMALLWTLGPVLLFVPRGLARLRHTRGGRFLIVLFAASMLPAAGSHLLVHFGVPGYAFHYVPALLALAVLGVGPALPVSERLQALAPVDYQRSFRTSVGRMLAITTVLAGVFLFYPTDFDQPGWRGDFDLAFARHTRAGLAMPVPSRQPNHWRTANSHVAASEGPGSAPRLAR